MTRVQIPNVDMGEDFNDNSVNHFAKHDPTVRQEKFAQELYWMTVIPALPIGPSLTVAFLITEIRKLGKSFAYMGVCLLHLLSCEMHWSKSKKFQKQRSRNNYIEESQLT